MSAVEVNAVYCRMKKATNPKCLNAALDFLNQFVVAGVEYPDAVSKVLAHFNGVDQAKLREAYDKA